MTIYDSAGRLRFPSPSASGARPADDTVLLVRQAYCPSGHPLVRPDHPRFRDEAAIGLLCSDGPCEGLVFLSPYGGDKRKIAQVSFRPGTPLRLMCPQCRAELPALAPHDCRPGASYVVLFLSRPADWSHVLALCNVWECPAAFLRKGERVLAEFQSQILPTTGSA